MCFLCVYAGLYSSAFQPIQPADVPTGDQGSGAVVTHVPTPVRNPRPPLLATPPGFNPTSFVQAGKVLVECLLSPVLHGPSTETPLSSHSVRPTQLLFSAAFFFLLVQCFFKFKFAESNSKNASSPNKSPPHPTGKGFNPNAPSFVPTQQVISSSSRQGPSNVSTLYPANHALS